ncbi:MAG: hypothetical protein ABSB15_12240 [Bryobacteraceae bacterium]
MPQQLRLPRFDSTRWSHFLILLVALLGLLLALSWVAPGPAPQHPSHPASD